MIFSKPPLVSKTNTNVAVRIFFQGIPPQGRAAQIEVDRVATAARTGPKQGSHSTAASIGRWLRSGLCTNTQFTKVTKPG